MSTWRESLEDPLIQEIVQFARDHHLDLSVSKIPISPWDVRVEELVDPAYVKRIAKVLLEAEGWPDTMPIPVVMGGGTTWIMDGSHRTTAARVARLDSIPVLVASSDAYFLINQKYDIPMFDYVHSILPAVDPLMAENELKDEEGGKAKRRSAEPDDMSAFGDPTLSGTVRREPRRKRGATEGLGGLMDIVDTPEYQIGFEWATEHGPVLAELFSSREVSTPELRARLFQEATRRWPSKHDDLANDLRQVAFVAGAMKAAIRTLPMAPESMIAMNETAMEIGSLWGAEQVKAEALQVLQEKPSGWWRKKIGAASPNDVVNALSSAWRHDWAKERGRQNPRSKWEVLIDATGAREIWILANTVKISEEPGSPSTYTIESPEDSFQIISRPLFEGGRLLRYPGEIVG